MLVLHMMTRTHHEVNHSDRSVCGIGMMITGSLSQMLDDTKNGVRDDTNWDEN